MEGEMNIAYLIAGGLCLYGAYFHEKVGTGKIATPIVNSQLDQRIKTIAKIVWHSVTFSLLISGCFLFFMGFGQKNILAANLIILYLFSFAVLFLYFSKTMMGKAFFFIHPSYFGATSLLIVIGNIL